MEKRWELGVSADKRIFIKSVMLSLYTAGEGTVHCDLKVTWPELTNWQTDLT